MTNQNENQAVESGNENAEESATLAEIQAVVVDPESLVIRTVMPGILVSLTCKIRGGITTKKYNKETRELESGEVVETWDAKRVFIDKPEYKKCDALRGSLRNAIKKLGCETAVGLIIPAHKKADLAQALQYCRMRARAFNETSQSCDLMFRYGLHNPPGNDSGSIAAITDQLGEIMATVQATATAEDQDLLDMATPAMLKPYSTAKDVMLKATAEERRVILTRVRASLTRKAMAEAQSFSALLPEDAGLQLTDACAVIKKQASSWVKASKKGDSELQESLDSFDVDGINAMQNAFVEAASLADSKAEALEGMVATGNAVEFDAEGLEEDDLGDVMVAPANMDLFKTDDDETDAKAV